MYKFYVFDLFNAKRPNSNSKSVSILSHHMQIHSNTNILFTENTSKKNSTKIPNHTME